METKLCPACKSELIFRSGTSKKGKPYAFWGCGAFPVCEYTEQAPRGKGLTPERVLNRPVVSDNSDIINALRTIYLLLDERLPAKEVFPEPPADTTEEDLAKFNITP